jgi:putative PIN family toxin of toxin-antitoxin system
VVANPGVLVSALISPRGAPARLLEAWSTGLFDLVVSNRLLGELGEVLGRRKFRRYVSEARAQAFVAAVAREGVLVDDPSDIPAVGRDRKDDYLLALARESHADLIVSGDPHLTELTEIEPPVLTPREFVSRLQPS